MIMSGLLVESIVGNRGSDGACWVVVAGWFGDGMEGMCGGGGLELWSFEEGRLG